MDKKYLISFLASLKGDKAVVGGLNKIKQTTKKVGITQKKATGMTHDFTKALRRVAIVVPMWMAFRMAMQAVTQSMRFLTTAFIDLDEGLARIKTVMQGTGAEVEAQMIAVKQHIMDASTKSRLSIKELAEGFYFLKTANLSAEEAMYAFDHTVNLAVGTQNSLAQSARAVAGIYNTMGKYLGDNLTINEKFAKISDVLAYTYATQDVQLGELIASYTKLAPYITGLSDGFTELTTMLGFLNTRLLRAGRTGRLTGRAILQLTKNAKKLANQFGITFKQDEAIPLLKTIGKIHTALKQTGKATAEQSQQIQKIFATRGGVAMRLLLEHWEDLNEQIKLAIDNSGGFAEKMNEIKMGTITSQTKRLQNIFAVLFEEYMTGYTATKNLASAIQTLGDSLEELKVPAKRAGQVLGWLREGLGDIQEFLIYQNEVTKRIEIMKKAGVREDQIEHFMANTPKFAKVDWTSWREYLAEQNKFSKEQEDNQKKLDKLQTKQTKLFDLSSRAYKKGDESGGKELEKRAKLMDKIINELLPKEAQLRIAQEQRQKNINSIEEARIGFVDKYNAETSHSVALMKEMGASALAIAKYQLERAVNEEFITEEQKYNLAVLKAQQKVIQETTKQKQQLITKFEKAEISMLKILGASELQILGVQEKQLRNRQQLIEPIAYTNNLLDMQLEKEIALQNQIKKRQQLFESVMSRILEAEGQDKDFIAEALTGLLPETGATFENVFSNLSEGAKKVAFDLRNLFTPEQQTDLFTAMIREAGIEVQNIAERIQDVIESQPELDFQKIRAGELLIDKLQVRAVDGFTIGELGKSGGESVIGQLPTANAPPTEVKVNFSFGNINIDLPATTKENLPREAGKALEKQIAKFMKSSDGKKIDRDNMFEHTDKGK